MAEGERAGARRVWAGEELMGSGGGELLIGSAYVSLNSLRCCEADMVGSSSSSSGAVAGIASWFSGSGRD